MISLIEALERVLPRGSVLWEPWSLEPYARDESDVGRFVPETVVFPRSAEEVQAVLAVARERKVPVVPRGAGTGKSGGALAVRGGIVLSVERWDRVLEVRVDDMQAVVEPGVVTGRLMEAVEARGLFYPPDPNSLDMCTIAGNIAHNAGGPRALKYGVTRDYVLGLEIVLATGERLRTGKRTIKGVAGYDLTALMVGSEGTLGVVTEATLQLIPLPRHVSTGLALFPSEAAAAEAVGGVFAAGLLPRAMELFDALSILAAEKTSTFRFPAGASAALLFEVDGTAESCAAEIERIGEAMTIAGAADVLLAQNASQQAELWSVRRKLSISLRSIKPLKVSEDIAVPRGSILQAVRDVRALGEKSGFPVACYGHAGDGNLHVNVLYDEPAQRPAVEKIVREIVKRAVELGGTITGEHGVGLAKRDLLPLEQAPGLIELQRRIKRVFDPDGILNPGKIF